MNDIRKYTIEGVLTTTSPLHITQPGAARWAPDGSRRAGGTFTFGDRGYPLTLTRSATAFLGGVRKANDEEPADENCASSFSEKVPVIPASTWRGMLRRGAARVIEDHLIQNLNAKLTYDAYHGLHCGAISGNPDGVAPTTDEMRSARTHVFYGIFGGGPRMLPGALRASDSLPVTSGVIEANLLPPSLIDVALKGVEARDLYTVSHIVRKDDIMGAAGAPDEAEPLISDFDQAFNAAREQQAKKAARRLASGATDAGGEAETGDRGVHALSFRQDVAVGVPFNVRLEIKGTAAQVGMLIAAMDRRLPDGIGGRGALGFGRVRGTLSVVDDTGKRVEVIGVEDGSVHLLDGANPFLDAQAEAVSALSLDDIMRYLTSVVSAETKAAKAAKKAKQ